MTMHDLLNIFKNFVGFLPRLFFSFCGNYLVVLLVLIAFLAFLALVVLDSSRSRTIFILVWLDKSCRDNKYFEKLS